MSYECPHCQSENTNKLSISYENGLTQVRTRTAGIGGLLGLFGPAIGVGLVRTRGTHQTGTSLRATPPRKKSFIKPFILSFIVGCLANLAIAFYSASAALKGNVTTEVFLLVLSVYLFYTWHFNSRVWPKQMAAWNGLFICNRCGETFTPGR